MYAPAGPGGFGTGRPGDEVAAGAGEGGVCLRPCMTATATSSTASAAIHRPTCLETEPPLRGACRVPGGGAAGAPRPTGASGPGAPAPASPPTAAPHSPQKRSPGAAAARQFGHSGAPQLPHQASAGAIGPLHTAQRDVIDVDLPS